MKKLVAVLALVLIATPALAVSIKNTKHDLSSLNTLGSGSNVDEVCVFCHTPHASNTVVTDAPLWNRSDYTTTLIAYSSSSMDATIDTLADSDAPLCLSCHDTGTVAGALFNPPNKLGATAVSVTATVGTNAMIGANLKNDHPIGFSYADVAGQTNEFIAAPAAPIDFFGTGGDEMWCSSCHDVHDNANVPFLRINNAGSNLCVACHKK